MAFFILQAQYFYDTGLYKATKKALAEVLSGEDGKILTTCQKRKEIQSLPEAQIQALYADLITWCSNKIAI